MWTDEQDKHKKKPIETPESTGLWQNTEWLNFICIHQTLSAIIQLSFFHKNILDDNLFVRNSRCLSSYDPQGEKY